MSQSFLFSFFFRALQVGGSLLLWLLTAEVAQAQTPDWQTAIAVNGGTTVTATTSDASGNIYLAGYFVGTLTLGNTTLMTSNTSTDADAFVAKWSPASNSFVWLQAMGGLGYDWATGIAATTTGLYVAGNFRSSTATFGTFTLRNAGSADVFVAKILDAGLTSSLSWVQQAGGEGDDLANALTATGSALYLVGTFGSASASFGRFTLPTPSSTSYSAFITKLTDAGSTGSFTWAYRAGGTGGYDEARAVAVSGTSVYVTGGFQSTTATFGSLVLTKKNPASSSSDVFVTKLTDAGNSSSFTWAQQAGGTAADLASGLVTDGASVYVVGTFTSDTFTAGSSSLTNPGVDTEEGFVAKLTDGGTTSNFAWAQRLGGVGRDYPRAIAMQEANLYIAGSFNSTTASFGPTTLTNKNTTSSADIFLTRLLDAGTTSSFRWTQQAGGSGDDRAYALSLAGNQVYVAGTIAPPVTFGSLAVTATGGAFLASLLDNTLLATAATASAVATLYPNPAHQTTRLQLPAALRAGQPTTVHLLNSMGQVVGTLTQPATVEELALPLRGLPPGMYTVQAIMALGTISRRLTVE